MPQGLIRHTGHKVEASIVCASAIAAGRPTHSFPGNLFHSYSVFSSAEDASMEAAAAPGIGSGGSCGGDFRRLLVKKQLSTLIEMQGLKIFRPLDCFSVSFDFYFFMIQ